MENEKSILWIGAALLAVAISAAAIATRQDEAAAPKPAVQQNLFPFLKPMHAAAPDVQGKSFNAAQSSVLRDAQLASTDVFAAQTAAKKMREQGASEDDVNRMRAAMLPVETAAILAQMDSEEAAWKARVTAYLSERNRLLESAANHSGTDQPQALQQLRDSRFTSEEQNLLATYESSGAPLLVQ